jgi:hypothetical protein
MTKRSQTRIEWRDNLLTKYEKEIEELRTLLRIVAPYIVHPNSTEIRKEIDKALSPPTIKRKVK